MANNTAPKQEMPKRLLVVWNIDTDGKALFKLVRSEPALENLTGLELAILRSGADTLVLRQTAYERQAEIAGELLNRPDLVREYKRVDGGYVAANDRLNWARPISF